MKVYRGKCPLCSGQLEQFVEGGENLLRCEKQDYLVPQVVFERHWNIYEAVEKPNSHDEWWLLRRLTRANRITK